MFKLKLTIFYLFCRIEVVGFVISFILRRLYKYVFYLYKATLPSAIYKMDDESKVLYEKALKSGSEVKREIRVLIVGKKGAGKTSLTRRLLFKSIDGVTSTNGIDIHSVACDDESAVAHNWNEKAKTSTDSRLLVGAIKTERQLLGLQDEEENENSRLLVGAIKTEKQLLGLQDEKENERSKTISTSKELTKIEFSVVSDSDDNCDDNGFKTSFSTNVKTEEELPTVSSNNEVPPVSSENKVTIETLTIPDSPSTSLKTYAHSYNFPTQTDNEASEKSNMSSLKTEEIETNLADVAKADLSNENEIRISIWDFGGDEEFYYTHQMFLAEEVVFVVVTSLIDSSSSHGEFKFWLDTIHSMCKERDGVKFEPRCIVVGTHKDKCKREDAVANIKSKQKTVGKLWGHIYGEVHLISNTDHAEEEVESIRIAIINAGREGKDWETEHPLKFILLDKALEKKRNQDSNKPIISLEEIRDINGKLKTPLSQAELDLYLRYNHIVGHLIYYEEIPDFVVLNAQWLSDVFRCIVTADKFQQQFPELEFGKMRNFELENMRNTGEVSDVFLDKMFKIQKIDEKHRRYMLQVLEKFHILIWRPASDKMLTRDEQYFAPCMVRDKELMSLNEQFNEHYTDRSSCLCIVCDFLPPFLFSNIIMLLCERYQSSVTRNLYPAFFSNAAIFDISPSEKLVVLKYQNVIQSQVYVYGNQNLRSYIDIKELLENLLKQVTNKFSMNISFDFMIKCSKTSYDYCDGLLELTSEFGKHNYICKEHLNCQWFEKFWVEKKRVLKDTESLFTPEMEIKVLSDYKVMTTYGSSVRVLTLVRCDIPLYDVKVSWEKRGHENTVSLDLSTRKYFGSSTELPTPDLVINDVSWEDAGVYQLEVVSRSCTVVGHPVTIDVPKDLLEVETMWIGGHAIDCIIGSPKKQFKIKSEISKNSLDVKPLLVKDYAIDCIISRPEKQYKTSRRPVTIEGIDVLNAYTGNEFEIILHFQKVIEKHQNIELLQYSVQRNNELLCRLMISHLESSIEDDVDLVRDTLMEAIKNGAVGCSKALSWLFTRLFYKSKKSELVQVDDIWPAFRCSCPKGRYPKVSICSSDVQIIVEHNEVSLNIKMFHGIPVRYVLNQESSEAKAIHDQIQQTEGTIHFPSKTYVNAKDAEDLFDRHSKLTMISPSAFKSSGLIPKKSKCLQLFCTAKQFIPVGENHFPTEYNGLPTDVIEGSPSLCTRMNLKVGSVVSRARKGTLGGFLKIKGREAYATCAHVLFSPEQLASDNYDIDDMERLEINLLYTFPLGSNMGTGVQKSGDILDVVFKTDSDRDVSIDAALVEVNKETMNIDPNDYVENVSCTKYPTSFIGMQSEYLNTNCIDYRTFCFSEPKPIVETVFVGGSTGIKTQTTPDSTVQELKPSDRTIYLENISEDIFLTEMKVDLTTTAKEVVNRLGNNPSPSQIQQTLDTIFRSNEEQVFKKTLYDVISEFLSMKIQQPLINIDDILKNAVEYKTRTNYSAIVADVHMQKVFLLRYLDRQTTHRTSRRMYGQLYITNTPAMPGDSGSCIYAKQPKQGCLGLLIGVHPDRSGSIVTPITEVLKAFRVKFSQT